IRRYRRNGDDRRRVTVTPAIGTKYTGSEIAEFTSRTAAMPKATMTTVSASKIRPDAANVHARCKIGRNASRTAPATSIAANRNTNWTSAAVAIVNPSIEVVLSRQAEIA